MPTLEERAKFVDGSPVEVTHSIFQVDTMLMMPFCKWKCTYEDSCGNHKATIGKISDVLNFPREIPVPAKSNTRIY